jgi:hypothetical protein
MVGHTTDWQGARPMTAEEFIQTFRERHRWRCPPGTRITLDLAEFATTHASSNASAEELYELFCVTHGLKPKIGPRREARQDPDS